MIKADPNVVRFRRARILYLSCVSPLAILVVANLLVIGPPLLSWLELIGVLILIPSVVFSTTLQMKARGFFESGKVRAYFH